MPKPNPASGGARQKSPKSRNLKIGGAFWLKSELFLTKIRTANFDAPPRHRSLMLATPQKSFLHFSRFARPRFFLLKGKENFFAGFCSERAGRRGRPLFFARARRNSPHTPLPPCPRLGRRIFLRGDFYFFLPLPRPSRARARHKNSLRLLYYNLEYNTMEYTIQVKICLRQFTQKTINILLSN